MSNGWVRGVNKAHRVKIAPFTFRQIKLTEKQFLIWFSAWLDTEGSIVLYGDKKYPVRYAQLSIYQKDVAPLKMIQERMGGSILNQRFEKSSPIFRWVMSGYKAVEILKKVARYLVVKRNKAINVIQYYELKNSGKADFQVHEKYIELVNDQGKNRQYLSRIIKESEKTIN